MKKFDGTAYVRQSTGTIHLVGDGMFLPLTSGYTNCGQSTSELDELKGFSVFSWLREAPHSFCLKCLQLNGLVK